MNDDDKPRGKATIPRDATFHSKQRAALQRQAAAAAAQPALLATYNLSVTLRAPGAKAAEEIAASGSEPLEGLRVSEVEGLIKASLEDYGYTVNVTGTRTDK